jgi:predicted small lipoprotein YifL
MGHARTLAAPSSVLALTVVGALAGCGAKTGLEIEYVDAPMDAPHIDAGRDAGPPDAPLCRPGSFSIEPARADMMLVIDRSGSMRLGFDGQEDLPAELWRWSFLRNAVAASLPTLGDRVRIGAKLYPDPIPPDVMEVTAEVACRSSDGVDVRPAVRSTPSILAAMDAFGPIGGTPTVEALIDAREALADSTEGRRFIVIATDGGPNCNPLVMADPVTCTCTSAREACLRPDEGIYSCVDDPRMTNELDTTNTRFGIPVFIIGIPDDSRRDLTDYLDRMAVAGGRPRSVPGERQFYSARSDRELRDAFEQITGSISRCAFVSPSVPTDETQFFVAVDGERLARDRSNGWTWTDRDRGEIELHGPACERANAPGAIVEAFVDSCPDT